MLISRRRFYWAIVLTLLFAAFALVRPLRTWVDRAIVAATTNGSMAVDQLHLHFADSVVEAQGLEIHREQEGRQFGMRAGKTWVAVDGVGVIDRRYAAPTVLVEDAVLYLSNLDETAQNTSSTAWHDALAQRLSGITWTELQKHFGSVLAAGDVAGPWDEKIASYVKRSEELLTRLRAIESEAVDFDNPLRYEGDVRDRLHRIEALQAEQEVLARQFAAARKTLEIEAEQLRKKFETEKEAFAVAAIDADLDGMASEILTLSGREAWRQLSAFCEIASRMADIQVSSTDVPWNKNFRQTKDPLVDLPVIKVSGMFESGKIEGGLTQVPFSAQGAILSQDGARVDQATWDYSFFEMQRLVELGVAMAGDRSQAITIAVQLDRDESGDARLAATGDITICDSQYSDEAASGPQMSSTRLSGKIQVYASAFTRGSAPSEQSVGREQQILATALSRQGPEACIVFDLSGTWQSPQLTSSQPAQQWLIDQIRESIRPSLQDAIADATDKLESELQLRLVRMNRSAQIAAQAASSIASEQSNPLYAARNRLQASLDEISGAAIRR